MAHSKYIKWFSEIRAADVELVGGKNASLGEMVSQLASMGVPVPNGYAITKDGFYAFLEENNLREQILKLAAEYAPEKNNLSKIGNKIRGFIDHGKIPKVLEAEIISAYREMSGDTDMDVAVRSSATVEDGAHDSFAGQFETYLNVSGEDALLEYVKRCFASLFTDRGISYRHEKGYSPLNIGLSVGVQKMVRSDKGAAGVMFTLDTESGFRQVVFIQGSWGLGEMVVQGAVNPDTYYVFKPTGALVGKSRGPKRDKMIYSHGGNELTQVVKTSSAERDNFSLSDEEVLILAKYALIIEKHYSAQLGRPTPMDIEWAKCGIDGKLYIVQARPETVMSRVVNSRVRNHYVISKNNEAVVAVGSSVGNKIAFGPAQVILSAEDIGSFVSGSVLVTDITTPDWEPIMKQASAIVTNRGGRTCHAAIISRELGIPAVVGCNDATKKILNGQMVTVSCAEGDEGFVYEGKVSFVKKEIDVSNLQKPKRTKIMLNVADPKQAFSLAAMYGDLVSGVGLLRLELIGNRVRVHPEGILNYDSLEKDVRDQIGLLMKGYKNPRDFYISTIAQGIGTIAAAFYPNPVIVRLSDYKTNEYCKLVGGNEPDEENPMLGWRGAGRLTCPKFLPCAKMELEALHRAYFDMGLTNIKIMVPFVRTLQEGRAVMNLLAENGLQQVTTVCMCELPVNVLLAKEFLEIFPGGFSIGSNDLTQLTLGVDRDNGMTGDGLDERNPAVLALMKRAIEECNLQEQYSGICGQAPSDFPEITRMLVGWGITSISLNPDSVFSMLEVVAEAEKELGL